MMCVRLSYNFSAPEDFKVSPGAVEAIAQHPLKSEKVCKFLKTIFYLLFTFFSKQF